MSAESDEVRRERKAQGYTQRTLAKASGVGLRSITRIETGEAERDGKDKDLDTRSLVMLQRFLRCGPYKPPSGQSEDPPLSQATPAELLRAVARTDVTFAEVLDVLKTKHGQEVRAAQNVARNGSQPRRPKDGGAGMATPSYDGSEFEDQQESDRANRPGDVG